MWARCRDAGLVMRIGPGSGVVAVAGRRQVVPHVVGLHRRRVRGDRTGWRLDMPVGTGHEVQSEISQGESGRDQQEAEPGSAPLRLLTRHDDKIVHRRHGPDGASAELDAAHLDVR